MKRKLTGRPKKSARESYHWLARITAKALREALKIPRDPDRLSRAISRANLRHVMFPADIGDPKLERACLLFGLWVYASCDADHPAKFLRQLAKEVDGKLKHSPADERLLQAYWNAEASKGLPTLSEVKVRLGNGPLPADWMLRRSLKRLGKPLLGN
jgi:hypothetical protein